MTEALRVTGGERQDNYGHPLANHKRIADLWNGYLRARAVDEAGERHATQPELTPVDVVQMMITV